MILAVVSTIVGLALSAFFSGSETGFYRVARVRLLMHAKSGEIVARCLLWLVKRPSLVIATVLIGNNIANYLVSFGLLLVTQRFMANWSENVQAVMPVVATPILFIYGELLPKHLYFHAPYRLSTRGAPLMLLFAALFLPLSLLIITLEILWQRIAPREGVQEKLSLERQQLQRVLLESQEAGILVPIQRELAQNIFTFGVRAVRHFASPLRAIPWVTEAADREAILAQARRFNETFVGVLSRDKRRLIGAYLVADTVVLEPGQQPPMHPVPSISANENALSALAALQSQQAPVAQVVDSQGNPIGAVTLQRLTSLLLRAG